MSDVDPKLIEELKAHDERVRHIDDGLALEQALENTPILKAIFARLGEEATAAMEELITANPADPKAIIELQSRVYRATALERYVKAVIERGRQAQAEMIQEGGAEQLNGDG